MKVSLLIPTYNNARHLHECLTSVLEQNFADMEILISDDCSKDGTLEIIQEFAARDARIRWWQNKNNLGLTQNHNACLRAAQGEYIKIFHGDDKFLSPDTLSRMVKVLDENPSVTLVCTGSERMDGNSLPLAPQVDYWTPGNYDGKAAIVRCLENNANLIGEPSRAMYRRRQARRGYDERYRQVMDLEMGFHLLEQGQFGYLADRLVSYRVHPEQATVLHHRLGICSDELLLLATEYNSKPWISQYVSRKMQFTLIYYLRKNYGDRAITLTSQMMANLKPFWYAIYWLNHKLIHPFEKLRARSQRKRAKHSPA